MPVSLQDAFHGRGSFFNITIEHENDLQEVFIRETCV